MIIDLTGLVEFEPQKWRRKMAEVFVEVPFSMENYTSKTQATGCCWSTSSSKYPEGSSPLGSSLWRTTLWDGFFSYLTQAIGCRDTYLENGAEYQELQWAAPKSSTMDRWAGMPSTPQRPKMCSFAPRSWTTSAIRGFS